MHALAGADVCEVSRPSTCALGAKPKQLCRGMVEGYRVAGWACCCLLPCRLRPHSAAASWQMVPGGACIVRRMIGRAPLPPHTLV
jgi:hypothetical protein